MSLTIGSLFSGIGGLELGLEWAGLGPVLWQVEKDHYCLKVLEKHWPNVKRYENVETVGSGNLERVDLICGGFPCQDLSYAGRGAGIKDGTRSGLWFEFARIIRELRPRFVVVENVPALLTRGMDIVLGELATLRYDAWWDCISAQAVGAPHRRDRVFIIGHTNSNGKSTMPIYDEASGVQGNVPNSSIVRRDARGAEQSLSGFRTDGEKGALADTDEGRRDGWTWMQWARWRRKSSNGNWWSVEPSVGRVADGISTELDETVRRFGHGQSSDKEVFTKIIQHRRRILRILWEHEQFATPSSRGRCIFNYTSLPEVSYSDTYEGWILGAWIEKDKELRCMWEKICSEPFEETQDLQQRMLEYIGTQERNEKVASSRVDRLRALGNAVVPQVAQVIGEIVKGLAND